MAASRVAILGVFLVVSVARAWGWQPLQAPSCRLLPPAAANEDDVAGGSRLAVKEEAELATMKKAELVAMCRSAGLKVSGNKAALVARLVAASCEAEVSTPIVLPATPLEAEGEREEEENPEAVIDALINAVAAAGENVDPGILASRADLLLRDDATIFERVCKRRQAPADAAAVALLRGFVSAEQKLQARDVVRYVLRTAVEAPHDMDKSFKLLSDAGKLNAALLAYVEDLLAQQQLAAQRDSGSLLAKVLGIVKDRILAERQAAQSDELRTLAEAMRLTDPKERRDFLRTKLATSLDFAMRFEAYMREAAAYVDDNKLGTQVDAQAILDINVLVTELRARMPA